MKIKLSPIASNAKTTIEVNGDTLMLDYGKPEEHFDTPCIKCGYGLKYCYCKNNKG